ncbi:MAG: hypothetical protein FJ260_10950 [Planctomycetes bacterium]|nr:hypothetical protein [Planctomycetota bacterium]
MKTVLFVAAAASAVAASADAGFLGFAAFSRLASNGNRVIDVVAVVSNASDRLLNIYNSTITNNAGAGGASFFTQQAGTATRGWKPDAASSTRSNNVDSFMTIGVEGGEPYEGQYFASGGTSADGNFSTGWTTLGNTVPPLAGWFLSPPTLPDNRAESLSTFTGTRLDNGGSASSNFGIWCGHLVMNGAATSCLWSATAAIKDGVTMQNSTGSAVQFQMIPAPGAIALVGVAGLAASRRRRA